MRLSCNLTGCASDARFRARSQSERPLGNDAGYSWRGTTWPITLLSLLLVLALPAVVQAQFNYTTNDGTITLTGYSGPGGAVAIPDTINGLPVTRIGDFAFYAETSLTSVTIPNSVTSIGDSAFYYCTSLTSVTFGDSVTSIGDGAFGSCISLTSVTIPNNVTSIRDSAFGGCTNLTSVTIPDSVTSIGDGAFAWCTSLSAITVDALNSFYRSVEGVLFNKPQTLLIQCPAGKAGSVTIPNSVTSIRDSAFGGCTSLTSVTIPNSVTNIGYNAFRSCTSLTNVTIPNSVTSIRGGAFIFCNSLTSVTIGNSVTSIGDGAFIFCESLTSVTIPKSVTFIGAGAFSYCAGLTGVYFQGSAPSFGIGEDGFVVFHDANATVYYLPGTTGWEAFTEAIGPAVLWNPLVDTTNASFGVRTNRFGFTITGASNLVLVVVVATDLANPDWVPVGTNTLTGGASYFSDPDWTNHPARFYRLRSP